MQLYPIQLTLQENSQLLHYPDSEPVLSLTIEFFNKIGYNPPWIGYFVLLDNNLIGSAAFKGKPQKGRVEIAYSVFPHYQQGGIGTEICRQLVLLAQQSDPTVTITARTLPEESYSTRILRKNDFVCVGTIWDEDDGDVWEWEYQSTRLR